MIDFNCRQCREDMEAPETLAGQNENCPNCGRLNRVPRLHAPGNLARSTRDGEHKEQWDRIDRLAELLGGSPFLAERPVKCWECGKELPPVEDYAIVGCPHCGRHPYVFFHGAAFPSTNYIETELEKGLRDSLPARQAAELARQVAELTGEPTEVARAAVGPEPSVARIQCRCSNCGTASESPPGQAGQDEICPECGRKLNAADRLASELIAFDAGATTRCVGCKTSSSVMQVGMTCPHCGNVPPEDICEGALRLRREEMGDWRKIKRLGELLSEGSASSKAPRFLCPFCKFELPSSLADRNFAHVECPRCHRVDVYVYDAEAFDGPRECQRILEFRLEKRKKAKEKARQRELAEAAEEIGTETQPDRAQANGGYVYALLNAAMPGLVKIGKTEREPDDRAKELSCGTGTPTPFVVAYAEWFKDCSAGEGHVHGLLEQKGFRVAQNREFFCAPVKAAIQAIINAKEREGQPGKSSMETDAPQ